MEVERTARVLDGSVLVIDAVAGVQAQTKSVWRCIRKRSMPAVIFINKMDRTGSDWQAAMKSIASKLAVTPRAMQLPVSGDRAVDLIGWKLLSWAPTERKGMPGELLSSDLTGNEPFFEEALRHRTELIEALAEQDDHFMELCLETEYPALPVGEMVAAIRRACIGQRMVPVVFGSALKGRGLQPLLDAVVSFLPSPEESQKTITLQHKQTSKTLSIDTNSSDVCALAFKVLHDVNRGLMVFARIYSGSLQAKQGLYNSTSGMEERAHQMLSVQADDMAHLASADAGSVVCLVGLKNTKTGDTLLASGSKFKDHVLEGLAIPPPVYSVALEPESESKQAELETALKWLCLEDPSVSMDMSESGQTVVSGLGELHLEILVDKLQRQYRVPVSVGQASIGYRESIALAKPLEQSYHYDHRDRKQYAELSVTVKRRADNGDCTFDTKAVKAALRVDEYNALLETLQNSILHGQKNYPVVGLDIIVDGAMREDGMTTPGAVRACAALLMRQLLQHADHETLEPIMEVEITAPNTQVGEVITDLTGTRRGEMKEIQEIGAGQSVISALVPLQTLIGYATALRSRSHGEASFTAEYHSYKPAGDVY